MQVSPISRSPCGAEPRQVDESAEREQRLIRRDVRRRLLAADVLLARREREHVATPSVDVGGLAHDAAGHAAHVLCAAGEEAVVRPAVATGRCPAPWPSPIAIAQPYRPGASSTPSETRVDMGDGQRARVDGRGREVRGRLEAAEEVRLLEDHGRGVLRRRGERRLDRSRRRVCGTSTTSRPNPGAYVFSTWRTCGLVASVTTTRVRPVACFAM